MDFNRPPRFKNVIEVYEEKLPFPPVVPQQPKINWLILILPLLITGGILGTLSFFIQGSSINSYILFLPFMLVSLIVSIVSYIQQKNEYKNIIKNSKSSYKVFLDEKTVIISQKYEQQLQDLISNDPDKKGCFERVQSNPPSNHLGERRPNDDDFLVVRFGRGKRKSYISIKTPEETNRDPRFKESFIELEKIITDFSYYKNAPLTVDFKTVGSLGIYGGIVQTQLVANALAFSLVTHHWFTEVNLLAICSSISESKWQWIKSLPHRSKLYRGGVIPVALHDQKNPGLLALENEIRRRESYIRGETKRFDPVILNKENLPALVVIVDRVKDCQEYASISLLLEKGKPLGLFSIILEDCYQDLPGECGAAIKVDEKNSTYQEALPGFKLNENIMLDTAELEETAEFAKKLSAINWLSSNSASEPPQQLTLSNFFEEPVDSLPVGGWWDMEPPFGFLRAPIGKFSPTADLVFDISEEGHGPHGIVCGTTGSGKSETLRTIILSLSLTHNPFDLNFALIDFKGGSAFHGLDQLPHVVGVITDIEDHADYANRVILSLAGEIQTRKKILTEAKERFGLQRAHIDDYRELSARRPLPHLVIIFDEFAEFKERHSEEASKLISFARVGRSLGIHLILCTQSPSVIVDQIQQNSKFRICLPVSSTSDSIDFIGIPDAANLTVGHAYFKIRQPQRFGVAYTGAYLGNDNLPKDSIIKINPNRSRQLIYPIALQRELPPAVTEAEVLIRKIKGTAELLDLDDLPQIWQPPLPDNLMLTPMLQNDGWLFSWNNVKKCFQQSREYFSGAVFGLIDEPINQSQSYSLFGCENKNHLLIYGGAGSGKTTLLRTIILNLARTYTPEQVWIYCLDFGAQHGLRILDQSDSQYRAILPHIATEGGIIFENDDERTGRLFDFLKQIIDARELAFHKGKASNIEQFNQKAAPSDKLPYIFLFIDGLYKDFSFASSLVEIINHGGSAGIFVVITAHDVSDVHYTVQNAIAGREEVILLKPEDISQVRSYFGAAAPDSYKVKLEAGERIKPGRGLINSMPVLEIQVGLPIDEAGDNQVESISTIVKEMNKAWNGIRPPDIKVLPQWILDSNINGQYDCDIAYAFKVNLGLAYQDLNPVGFSLKEKGAIYKILSDVKGKGKTKLLQTWILRLLDQTPTKSIYLYVLDFHNQEMKVFSDLPSSIVNYVGAEDDLEAALKDLAFKIKNRKVSSISKPNSKKHHSTIQSSSLNESDPLLLLIIDDIEAFFEKCPEDQIENLVKCLEAGEEFGLKCIITRKAQDWYATNRFEEMVLASNFGVLLGGPGELGKFNIPDVYQYSQNSYDVCPGRGFIIQEQEVTFFQAATFFSEGENDWEIVQKRINGIKKKYT